MLEVKRALIIGGGIAGIQSALDLAEAGVEVYLVESKPSIGGRMAQLDKTFPTNDCAMCILSPKLVETASHPNIRLITNADVESVAGEAGNFQVTVRQRARYVEENRCNGCGLCQEKCPVKIPDDFNQGISKISCIRIPFPQAVPAVAIIDREHCLYFTKGRCRICERFCQAKAVDFEQQDRILNLQVGGIILALGSDEFEASIKGDYGFRAYPNVVSSIEFERILSASGPTGGEVVRPSDGKGPKKIAFIQCVGSRDVSCGNDYCSAVCCMQATKDAIVAKEHLKNLEVSIFYLDMRAYGKDFDKYVERAEKEYGVRYIRSRIFSVNVVPESQNLLLKYTSQNTHLIEEEFDLVVLSLGLQPSLKAKLLANKLSIKLDTHGFSFPSSFSPVATSRPGIFACGVITGPKDIPETVMQASSATSEVSILLSNLPSFEVKREYPPQRIVEGEEVRIGVFVCHCGINIGGVVNVPDVVKYSLTLPHVEYAQEMLYACSQDSQKVISNKISEHDLNRIVIASCTPRTHEPLFQRTLRESGLNPYLLEMANIREQCSWVHMREEPAATEKAKDLVKAAVNKARRLYPLERMVLKITNRALVIGGGVAGMNAALSLAEQGYQVNLVEKKDYLGGNLREIYSTLPGEEIPPYLESLIARIRSHPKISLYLNCELEKVSGYVGNFKAILKGEESNGKELEAGVIIVATGGEELETEKFLYKTDSRVVTQKQLEKMIWERDPRLIGTDSIVMIQCVDSRDGDHPYCSRICCSQAIKNALRLKEENPKRKIYILYRDIRTYGMQELYYGKTREEGVVFLRYEADREPIVEKVAGELLVKVKEPILEQDLIIRADLLVLSVGIAAPLGNRLLAQMLKVPLNEEGFFLEAHVKLRPVDFATDGIFVCGLAHGPKSLEESIAQAKAAAARAATILAKTYIETEGVVAMVRKERCSLCATCVDICPYKAVEIDKKESVALVNSALCKGCGACAASCKSGAIDLRGFTDGLVLETIGALT